MISIFVIKNSPNFRGNNLNLHSKTRDFLIMDGNNLWDIFCIIMYNASSLQAGIFGMFMIWRSGMGKLQHEKFLNNSVRSCVYRFICFVCACMCINMCTGPERSEVILIILKSLKHETFKAWKLFDFHLINIVQTSNGPARSVTKCIRHT